MLRSSFCILRNLSDNDLYDLNECPYDSGGYFVINGSEKVLIAQERMATNHVYVFAKAQPSPISFLAEIRSAVEKGGKTISQFQVKMYNKNQDRSVRIVQFLPFKSPCQFCNRLETSSRLLSHTSKLTSLFGWSSVLLVLYPIVISLSIFATICKTTKC